MWYFVYTMGEMRQMELFDTLASPAPLVGAWGEDARRLEAKYTDRLHEEPQLAKWVSYVGNKDVPILRLYRYKEAFAFRLRQRTRDLLTVAEAIGQVKGEDLEWRDLEALGITERAWDKTIHHGIKPVRVFAHPSVLMHVPRAVGYYRTLAMVSQKSTNGVGLSVGAYED